LASPWKKKQSKNNIRRLGYQKTSGYNAAMMYTTLKKAKIKDTSAQWAYGLTDTDLKFSGSDPNVCVSVVGEVKENSVFTVIRL